jgi:hypothetical protein
MARRLDKYLRGLELGRYPEEDITEEEILEYEEPEIEKPSVWTDPRFISGITQSLAGIVAPEADHDFGPLSGVTEALSRRREGEYEEAKAARERRRQLLSQLSERKRGGRLRREEKEEEREYQKGLREEERAARKAQREEERAFKEEQARLEREARAAREAAKDKKATTKPDTALLRSEADFLTRYKTVKSGYESVIDKAKKSIGIPGSTRRDEIIEELDSIALELAKFKDPTSAAMQGEVEALRRTILKLDATSLPSSAVARFERGLQRVETRRKARDEALKEVYGEEYLGTLRGGRRPKPEGEYAIKGGKVYQLDEETGEPKVIGLAKEFYGL